MNDHRPDRTGTTFIDLVISIAIIAALFSGVYLVYFSLETSIANIDVRNAATTAINNEIELVRNLPYGSVGTVGGIPAGIIPQTQSTVVDNFSFLVQTTVLNIQDPYDATPSSTPVADYKLLDITASCTTCVNFAPVEITTTVAPSLLEQGTSYGSIFAYVLDADGLPVSGASVQVVNASVTPTIDLTDTTDASGVLKLIGVPTSTQGYQIFVSKLGYSSDQSYPPGAPGNPNPIEPNITVASVTVSDATFSIDRVSTLHISATDDRCVPVANEPLSIQGSRLIGTNPNVLRYATSSMLGADGTLTLPNMAWDTYALTLNDASRNVVGTIPFGALTLDPSSTQSFQFILQPVANPSLLVTIMDAGTEGGVENAAVTLSKGNFSETLDTDHATLSQSDWSGGQYTSESGIDTSVSGTLALLLNASSSYATGTVSSLISNTFDLGSSSSTLHTISWDPGSSGEPALTTLQFQIAANNDNAMWNFAGPNGPNTYFTASSSIPASFSGNRYLRYQAFMSTGDPSSTPVLDDIAFDFTGVCVPPAQVLFTNLAPGTYSEDVVATNYEEATATVVVGSGFQSSTIPVTALP